MSQLRRVARAPCAVPRMRTDNASHGGQRSMPQFTPAGSPGSGLWRGAARGGGGGGELNAMRSGDISLN